MNKILSNVISVILFGIIQVSFLTTWPTPINSLNLILIAVTFLAVLVSYEQSLIWSFGAGLFMELYSALPFGVTTLSLLLTVITINFLFDNFFTNRSFYSLMILGFLASIIYNLITFGFTAVAVLFFSNVYLLRFNLCSAFFWQPILNVLILGVIFLTFNFSTNRLKNMLLFSGDFYEKFRKF